MSSKFFKVSLHPPPLIYHNIVSLSTQTAVTQVNVWIINHIVQWTLESSLRLQKRVWSAVIPHSLSEVRTWTLTSNNSLILMKNRGNLNHEISVVITKPKVDKSTKSSKKTSQKRILPQFNNRASPVVRLWFMVIFGCRKCLWSTARCLGTMINIIWLLVQEMGKYRHLIGLWTIIAILIRE